MISQYLNDVSYVLKTSTYLSHMYRHSLPAILALLSATCPADFRISQMSVRICSVCSESSLYRDIHISDFFFTFHLVNMLQILWRPYSPRPCHSASVQNWYCPPPAYRVHKLSTVYVPDWYACAVSRRGAETAGSICSRATLGGNPTTLIKQDRSNSTFEHGQKLSPPRSCAVPVPTQFGTHFFNIFENLYQTSANSRDKRPDLVYALL